MPRVSRFVSDSIATFLLSILNRVLGIGTGIVLARYLGPVGKGYVAYAPVALELFVTAINGVAQVVTMQYGREGISRGAVHRSMLRIVLAVGIPCSVVIAGIALAVPSQRILIAAAFALPFAMYATVATGLLIAADRVSVTNIQRTILSSGFNAVTVCAVIFLHADYRIVLAAWVASYVVAALYSYIALRPFIGDGGRVTREIVKEQLQLGSSAGIAQLAGYVNMRIDVIVVSLVLGARAVGLYTLTVGLAELMWQFSSPLCFAAFPRIANGDMPASARFTAKLIRHIAAVMVPVGIFCFFAGPPLISLFYGRPFAESGEALRYIVPGVVAYAVEVPLGYFLMVRLARPWTIVVIQTVSTVICAVLTWATAHTYGIAGAAAATSVTYIAVVIVKGWIFARATQIEPSAFLLNREDVHDLSSIARRLLARAGLGARVQSET